MKPLVKCCLRIGVLMILTFARATPAQAQLVLYDNFNTTAIDPEKWYGTSNHEDYASREAVRELAPASSDARNRRLHLFLKSYAAIDGDSGGVGGGFGLSFAHPEPLREISFTVVVEKAAAIGCTTNPAGQTTLAAEFRGRFFNTEPSPTSELGDVELSIGLARTSTDAGTPLQAVAFYTRCDDVVCGARTVLDFQVLGSANPGQTVRLGVKWDQPNHRFVFRMNNAAKVLSPYSVSDGSLPFGLFKVLGIAKGVPHCTAQPRPVASMNAFFDNVFVSP